MAANNLAYEYYGTNTAPEVLPQGNPQKKREQPQKPGLRKVKKQKVNVRSKERASYLAVAKVAVPVVFFLAVFSVMCHSFSYVRTSRLELQRQQAALEIYQDQKHELEARLAKMVSVDKIEKIAVEKLGMIKLSDENKLYVNTAGKNKIVVSSEKD